MATEKPIACAPDDPNRCQSLYANQQCPYKALDGYVSCMLHAGRTAQAYKRKRELKQYRLNQWQARVTEFAEHEAVKSLREEIGIARLLMETIVGVCSSPNDLLQYHGKISDLLTKIERLVAQCHKLEAATGALIDKSAALRLAADFVDIIGKYITDEDILNNIGNECADLVAKAGKENSDG